MTWSSNTATLFGATGFIGRHLVWRLARAGFGIRVATRDPAHARHLQPAGAVGQIVPLRIDPARDEDVAAVTAGADVVINLIGILHPARAFHAVHVETAGRIAAAAAAAGSRHLVHVSALGADAAAEALYARTKAEGEEAVRQAFPGAVVLRPSVVFGPEDDFINRFAAMAVTSPALPLIGGGHTRFQPVYVGDVAQAAMAALGRPEARGRRYELGGPEIYTMRQILELILARTGRRRRLVELPWSMANLIAGLAERLPAPPLTRDQVAMLRRDNVVRAGAPGLAELGVTPTALEAVIDTWLDRFRGGGRSEPRPPWPHANRSQIRI